MASWRTYLTDQPIRRLDIITGRPSLLAAWTPGQRVYYFDLLRGTRVGERTFDDLGISDRKGEPWRAFLAGLTAPNKATLPFVKLPNFTVHSSADGRFRLIETDSGALVFSVDGKETPLELDKDTRFVNVTLDRSLGLVAALDTSGRLHTYQQHIRIGTFDLGLTMREDMRPGIVVSNSGTAIFVTDGQRIVLTNSGGRIRKMLDLHYALSALACSPDGKRLAVAEMEIGVIRVYNGADLSPTHQRFATDLLAEAKRTQLLGTTGLSSAALGPMVINNKGVIAFAVSGTACVSSLERMGAFPASKV